MRIVELILDEDQLANGIDAISIVSSPAIESNFIALKKQHEIKYATIDADKRILLGPALIPDKPIYRNQDGEEFYAFFTQQTVRKASQLYLMRGNQKNATLEHQLKLNGLSLVESWIKEDMEKDKSALYGMKDPIGTWMIAMKVENPTVWDEYVKTGLVKGFSIEGFFAEKSEIKASSHYNVSDELHEYICSLGYSKI
jgi:hypothetical protein